MLRTESSRNRERIAAYGDRIVAYRPYDYRDSTFAYGNRAVAYGDRNVAYGDGMAGSTSGGDIESLSGHWERL